MMKLSRKIFLIFFAVVIAGGLLSTLTGAFLLSIYMRKEAFSRVYNDLKVAKSIVNEEIEYLSVVSRLILYGHNPSRYVTRFPDIMLTLDEKSGLVNIVDKNGKVRNFKNKDFIEYLSARIGGRLRNSSGVVRLDYNLIKGLGYDFHLKENSLCDDNSVLILYSISGRENLYSFCVFIVNDNEDFINSIQNLIFKNTYYKGKPFGTVTVFCEDKRIATTVIGKDGKPAIGTKVSEIVKKKVLKDGELWLDRAFVVDEWYLSAYEQILSPTGKKIGILYVGVLEKKYNDIRNRAIFIFIGIIVIMVGILSLTVYFLSSKIVKPLTELVNVTAEISSGRFDVDIKDDSGIKEIKKLTENFANMVRAVEKREKLLIEKNRQLEETTRDYQELLRFVTHELNNSIGSLLLNVMILTDGTVGNLSDEQHEVAELILKDVERFRDMVKNYLNISRLERGKLICKPEKFNIKTLVVEPVVNRYKRRIIDSGFEIRWNWPEEYIVKADRELLDICYSNLIINAIKYGKDWIEFSIKFSIKKENNGYVLGVKNGGKPIDKDKIPMLFKKFSRLVKSSDGAGLGLYLVRKIVEQHGGKVWCESDETGTAFYMFLPD